MKTKKLYSNEVKTGRGYCFYFVTETPKTVKVEWVPHDDLDQNVVEKKIICKKDNRCQHCLKTFDNGNFVIYPYRNGQPFILEETKLEHIEKEIDSCKEWGVSTDYYEKLKQYL